MIKIAVVEDNLEDLEKIKNLLQTYKKLNSKYCIDIEYFSNPINLLHQVEVCASYDLFILGVYIKPIKGSQVALDLKRINQDCEIIFTTTSKSHAIFAYQINAMQYLLKPVDKESLFKTLDRFFKLRLPLEKYKTVIKTNKGLFKLNTKEVVYSEPEKNNYQAIILSNGKKLVVRMTVLKLYNILSINPHIIRCGASLNVNLKYINLISKSSIVFDNNLQVTYPFQAYSKLKEDFLLYKNK